MFAVAGVSAAAVSRGGPSFGLLDGLGGEGLEFADQLTEAPGVVEQGTITLELVLAERPGDGPGSDFADPRRVGAVEMGGVAAAPAPRGAAAGGALDEASGQARAERGDLPGDLALAVLAAGWW